VSVFLSQFPEEGEIMEHMVNNTFIMTQVLWPVEISLDSSTTMCIIHLMLLENLICRQ
jgi:hypothetical protein